MKIIKNFINPSKWANPQAKIGELKAIVIHWTAAPKAPAINIRNYFNTRTGSYGSAHFIISQDGEVMQVLDENFIGYHCGGSHYTETAKEIFGAYACSKKSSPNYYSYGIELCHDDWTGEFSEATLKSCVELVRYLREEYAIKHVIRHHDVTGKDCPKYFVNNPQKWEEFKKSIDEDE